jgi:hypothetical protein
MGALVASAERPLRRYRLGAVQRLARMEDHRDRAVIRPGIAARLCPVMKLGAGQDNYRFLHRG